MRSVTIQFAAVSLALAFSAALAAAQKTTTSPDTTQPLTFEVATIKPLDPNAPGMTGVKVYPGGRVTIAGASLKGLITIAFGLGYWQITGGESWMEKTTYSIEAKPPEAMQSSITNLRYSIWGIGDERLRQMLRALLVERFQLKFRQDIKTGDVYLLERSGKRLQLQPAKDRSSGENATMASGSSGAIEFTDGRFYLFNTSMPQLAQFANNYVVHRPVFDRTGLTGFFDYRSTMQVEPATQQDEFVNSFMSLIPEVGLKLKRAKGPVETFVIDHAEAPAPN